VHITSQNSGDFQAFNSDSMLQVHTTTSYITLQINPWWWIQRQTPKQRTQTAHSQVPLWSIGLTNMQLFFRYCHEPDTDLEPSQWKHMTRNQNQ
jgi:hypothetical protein